MLSNLEKILIFLGSSSGVWSVGKAFFTKVTSSKNPNTYKEAVTMGNYWRKEAENFHKKYVTILEENTALKIEKAIANSKKESIPLAMWEKDLTGRLVWCSDEYERLFLTPYGKTKADVLAKTDEESWGIIGKEWGENDKFCIENKTNWFGIEDMLSEGKNLLAPFHIYKNVIIYEGKVVGTLGVAIDINKKNERI